MFKNGLEPWHIIVLLVVIVFLFGGKRLPDATRSLGRSLRIFKSEIKSLQDDDAPATKPGTQNTANPPAPGTESAAHPETPPRVDG